MISFACFVPHAPVLIPEVGQKNLDKLSDTIKSYQYLEHELYSSKPDVLLVISPHAEKRQGAFTINQQPKLKLDFKDFGDLVTNLEFDNEIGFGYQVKESCEDYFPIILTANELLDYGTGVPLYFLARNLPGIKVINIGFSDLSNEDHIKFGEILKEQINISGKRVAIVASGDLSHKLHEDSPAGYSAKGQEFDQRIIELLGNKKTEDIVKLNKEMVAEAGECGYRSLLILLGVMKNINYTPEKLSYQSPFGIGYLVENFKIN
jgi:MEMO1 family protein